MAANSAGCNIAIGGELLLNVDGQVDPIRVRPNTRVQHRLVFDGSWPDCLHLHHIGNPNVLLIPRAALESPELPDEILSWLEALHKGWLP